MALRRPRVRIPLGPQQFSNTKDDMIIIIEGVFLLIFLDHNSGEIRCGSKNVIGWTLRSI